MIIVWRWWYFLGIAGIVLVTWGAVETGHATASGAEPADVAVAALQRGDGGTQPFVRIGEHVALYGHAVGWGDEDNDRLDWSIYPIIAKDHAYLAAWHALDERYPNPDDIPESEYPRLDGVNVFVMTERWKTVDDMQDGSELVSGLEGLLFEYEKMDKDEIGALRSIQPSLDQAHVRLLEEGRRPRPLWLCLTLGVGGVLLIGQAVRSFRRVGAQERAAKERQRLEAEAEAAAEE